MKRFVTKYWIPAAFILTGLLAGYLYWLFIGCRTGACPITANWHSSVIAGALIGYLAGSSVNDMRMKRSPNKEKKPQ